MKNVYFSHSRNFDYARFYPLIRKIDDVNFIFPEETNHAKSKEIIIDSDAFIAEVSEPSIGVGIEIGWADSFEIPILLILKKNSHASTSLNKVSNNHIEYENFEDVINKIAMFLEKF